MHTSAFVQKVIDDCNSFTEGMNNDIKKGAAFASAMLINRLSFNNDVSRISVMNAITRIVDKSVNPHYSLDFQLGITYFIDSVSHIAFLNNLIDPLEYWSFVSMMGTLRLSFISRF